MIISVLRGFFLIATLDTYYIIKHVKSLGRHVLVEVYGCRKSTLDNLDTIRELLMTATKEGGATIIKDVFHKFSPQGVSGVIVIAESHVAIHTWPELGYAAVDIFTCGTRVDPWDIEKRIRAGFKPKNVFSLEINRGNFIKK